MEGHFAEFGIIDDFEEDKDYSCYEAEKYHCIFVPDEILNDWWARLILMKSYSHRHSRPIYGMEDWICILSPYILYCFYNGKM